MKQKKVWTVFAVSLVWLLFSSGCGVYMAFTQPKPVDVSVLEPGKIQRGAIMAKCGLPVSSSTKADGSKVDVYEFYEGSSAGWAAGRGVFHLLADIFTLGLWEIIATPTEYGIRGDKLVAQAEFDSKDTLTAFTVLSREEKPLEKIHEANGF